MDELQTAVTDFLDYIANQHNFTRTTITGYRTALADAAVFFRGRSVVTVQAVDGRTLRAFLADLSQRGYAQATVSRQLSALRSLFRFLRRRGRIKTNPARGLKGPKRGQEVPNVLTAAEVVRLLDAPPKRTMAGRRDRAILETLYSAGLRVSELRALDVADLDLDLDLDAGVIKVLGKGRRERLGVLGRHARRALAAWLRVRETVRDLPRGEPVFTNKRWTRLSTKGIARIIKKYCAKPA